MQYPLTAGDAWQMRRDNRKNIDNGMAVPEWNLLERNFKHFRHGYSLKKSFCRSFAAFIIPEVEMEDKRKETTSYKEVRIGRTVYRVTSVFTGEKDLGKTLELLAIRRAMAELTNCPS